MANDDEAVLTPGTLVRARMELAKAQASSIDIEAYARRISWLFPAMDPAETLRNCHMTHAKGMEFGMALVPGVPSSLLTLESTIIEASRKQSLMYLEHALVAGIVSRAPLEMLVDYRNVYDSRVSGPSFPPAARDLSMRTRPVHPSTSDSDYLDLTDYPDAMAAQFLGGLTRIDGVPAPGSASPPRHVTQLLVSMTNRHADIALRSEQVRAFMAARATTGAGTMAIAAQIPAQLNHPDTGRLLARESAAAALYLGAETAVGGRRPLRTVVVVDSPNPRHRRTDGSAEDVREWLADAIRLRMVPADAVVVCGGEGDRRDLKEWRLSRIPVLDYRRTPLQELPLQEIEQQLGGAVPADPDKRERWWRKPTARRDRGRGFHRSR